MAKGATELFVRSVPPAYGNPDCQASEGFAKHVAEGDADIAEVCVA